MLYWALLIITLLIILLSINHHRLPIETTSCHRNRKSKVSSRRLGLQSKTLFQNSQCSKTSISIMEVMDLLEKSLPVILMTTWLKGRMSGVVVDSIGAATGIVVGLWMHSKWGLPHQFKSLWREVCLNQYREVYLSQYRWKWCLHLSKLLLQVTCQNKQLPAQPNHCSKRWSHSRPPRASGRIRPSPPCRNSSSKSDPATRLTCAHWQL
jgi:hypothetical protein